MTTKSSPFSEKSTRTLKSMSVEGETATVEHSTGAAASHGAWSGNWAWGVVLFIILVVILLIIFAAWQPKWMLRSRKGHHGSDSKDDHNRGLDWVRALLAAIVVAIVLIILYLLLRGIVSSWSGWGTY